MSAKTIVKVLSRLFWVIASFGLLALVLTMTNPKDAPAFVLALPIALLFVSLFLSIKLIFEIIRKLNLYSVKSPNIVTGVIVFTVCLFLIMQSINQLTARDVLLIVTLGFFIVWYLKRLRSS